MRYLIEMAPKKKQKPDAKKKLKPKPKPRPVDLPHDPWDVGNKWNQYKGGVFIVGSGTSLYKFDYGQLKNRYTIALNNAVKFFKPTFHLFSDTNLARGYENLDYSNTYLVCQGKVLKQLQGKIKPKEHLLKFVLQARSKDIVPEDNMLYIQRTVATGAIMLAFKLGFDKIYLLGIDGYCLPNMYYANGNLKKDRNKISKQDKPNKQGRIVQKRHKIWNDQMHELKEWFDRYGNFKYELPYDGVYNLSKYSTITAWPKVDPGLILCE